MAGVLGLSVFALLGAWLAVTTDSVGWRLVAIATTVGFIFSAARSHKLGFYLEPGRIRILEQKSVKSIDLDDIVDLEMADSELFAVLEGGQRRSLGVASKFHPDDLERMMDAIQTSMKEQEGRPND